MARRVRGIGASDYDKGDSPFEQAETLDFTALTKESATEMVSVYFEETGRVETPLFVLEDLKAGTLLKGPCMILQETQTIVVEPNTTARRLPRHVYIEVL